MFRYISNRVLQSSLLFLLSQDKLFAVIAGPTKKPNIAAWFAISRFFWRGPDSGAESARLPSDLERGASRLIVEMEPAAEFATFLFFR